MLKFERNAVIISSIMEMYNSNLPFMYGHESASFKDENNIPLRALRRMTRFINFSAQLIGINNFKVFKNKILIHERSGKLFIPIGIDDRRFWITAKGLLDDLRITQSFKANNFVTNIISGPCLFSKESVKALAKDGTAFSFTDPPANITKKIYKLSINHLLSIYEIESVLRLSLFINSLIKSSYVKKVFFNLPNIEYYIYIVDAYNKAYISEQFALEWFDKVDRRYSQLLYLMNKLTLEGLPIDIKPKVSTISPLAKLKKYIKEQVHSGKKVDFKKSINLLQKSSLLWSDLINICKPVTWIDLNNLSYVYAEILCQFKFDYEYSNQLTLIIENPMEESIFINARKILKEIIGIKNSANIIGIYPHEIIIPSDGKLLYDTNFEFTIKKENNTTQRKIFKEIESMIRDDLWYSK